jgi:hypothetical protein
MINLRLIVSGVALEGGVSCSPAPSLLKMLAVSELGGDNRRLLFAGGVSSFAVEVGGVGIPRLLRCTSK